MARALRETWRPSRRRPCCRRSAAHWRRRRRRAPGRPFSASTSKGLELISAPSGLTVVSNSRRSAICRTLPRHAKQLLRLLDLAGRIEARNGEHVAAAERSDVGHARERSDEMRFVLPQLDDARPVIGHQKCSRREPWRRRTPASHRDTTAQGSRGTRTPSPDRPQPETEAEGFSKQTLRRRRSNPGTSQRF